MCTEIDDECDPAYKQPVVIVKLANMYGVDEKTVRRWRDNKGMPVQNMGVARDWIVEHYINPMRRRRGLL